MIFEVFKPTSLQLCDQVSRPCRWTHRPSHRSDSPGLEMRKGRFEPAGAFSSRNLRANDSIKQIGDDPLHLRIFVQLCSWYIAAKRGHLLREIGLNSCYH